jgi:hypothetical protein
VYLFGSFTFNEFITYKKKGLECGVGGWCTGIGVIFVLLGFDVFCLFLFQTSSLPVFASFPFNGFITYKKKS